MQQQMEDFEQLMEQRNEVARKFVNGDARPLGENVAESDPATFFGPTGGWEEGAEQVWSAYRDGSRQFKSGSDSTLEILHSGASDSLGYWVGIQHASLNVPDKAGPVKMDLRVTEIFRRENGQWKLIHRHADRLANKLQSH